MCHRPNESATEEDVTLTINFKDMLHRFHTGENLESPYPLGIAEEVRFPGDRRKCDICHVPGMETVPLAEEALPTVISDGETVIEEIQATRAACTSCHDGLLPNVHAILATSPAPDNVETCAVCHGDSADFAVGLVHKIPN
jgi:OmcA/MtrC family decaheme c-type cytochrome